MVKLWYFAWQSWRVDGHFFTVETAGHPFQIYFQRDGRRLLLGGGHGVAGRFAGRIGAEDEERRDSDNDDANDDEDHERIREAGSLVRRSGGFHDSLDAGFYRKMIAGEYNCPAPRYN